MEPFDTVLNRHFGRPGWRIDGPRLKATPAGRLTAVCWGRRWASVGGSQGPGFTPHDYPHTLPFTTHRSLLAGEKEEEMWDF